MKKWKLFKIAWNSEKISQKLFLNFCPPPKKNRVPKKKLLKMRKNKVGQNCLIVWPEFCRPNFFSSDLLFFQTQHFSDPTFFRSKLFGTQIFSDPHWEILTLSFVWRIKGKLVWLCSAQFVNIESWTMIGIMIFDFRP